MFVEKYKSNLTWKETKYLTESKWQISNKCCKCKVHKCKSVQEAIALANDDHIEIYQPDDLKGIPVIAGPERYIETLLKPIVPQLITYIKYACESWQILTQVFNLWQRHIFLWYRELAHVSTY